MTAKDLFECINFLTSIRKDFAEDREIWSNAESPELLKIFEKDIEKRGIQCGQLDYYIRLFRERLEGIEI